MLHASTFQYTNHCTACIDEVAIAMTLSLLHDERPLAFETTLKPFKSGPLKSGHLFRLDS
eukprot:m.11064 g.11064  ORF g.11064 m.11064 type:complete len:60 (+) comp22953_c0_seq1:829-1008(+)